MNRKQLIRRIALIVFLGTPAFWMIFIPSGQRWVDIFLLGVDGDPTISFEFNNFSSSIDEETLKASLPKLEFVCNDQNTPFGTRTCQAPLAAFNDIPARSVSFFFAGGHLNAAKFGYQRAYHSLLEESVKATFGEPDVASTEAANQWTINGGSLLLARSPLKKTDEPTMFWLAMKPAQ